MFKRIALALVATSVLAPHAMAAKYPAQQFDATYSVTSGPAGKTELRMASDGKGRLATETAMGGQAYRTIIDYIGGTSTSLIPQTKMAMRSKLPPDGGYVVDEDSVKKLNGKSLGTKVVNGHPCHGYTYTTSGGKTETWIGDDCKIVVKSITDTAAGKTTMDLKSVGNKISADFFQVPSGYQPMTQ